MKTLDFESTVKPGDGIIIYKDHGHKHPRRDTRNFTFVGYSPCTGCGDKCPGYVDLTSARGDMQGCFRNDDNIRLEIVKQKNDFLPDELFEV